MEQTRDKRLYTRHGIDMLNNNMHIKLAARRDTNATCHMPHACIAYETYDTIGEARCYDTLDVAVAVVVAVFVVVASVCWNAASVSVASMSISMKEETETRRS